MTAARRLHTTRALLDTPAPAPVPGQLTLDQARETVPDGTFGGHHTPTPAPRSPLRPWTPEEQHQHRQDLLEALNGWDWHDDYQDARRTRERNRTRRTPAGPA